MAETVTATTTAVSTQVMTALDAGSGVDVVSLARNLTDAEKVPKQALIQKAIDNAEAQVSGYGLISSQLSLLQTAFEGLNDTSEVADSYGATTDTALGFTAFDGTEVDGSYAISVNQLALEKIMISDEYNASDYAIGTDSFDISITVGSSNTTTAITVSSLTPAGVVSAINTADTGVTASLVDTGTDGTNYRIILTGETGSEGAFTISSTPDLGFGDAGNTLQAAQDAEIEFDGLTITRGSNEFSDVVTGATLTLYETTASAATVAIYSDTSALQSKLENIVAVYNDFRDLMDELTTSTIDEDIEHSGDLQRDFASARYITNQIRDALREDSSTASGDISAFRDIGVTINSKGDLTFDEATFDQAVEDNYSDVVMMLTANTNDQGLYGSSSVGMAQDIALVIDALLASDGIVATRESNAADVGEEYEEELATLETRMELLYDRYISQFTAMEVLTEKLNGIRDYLEGQLESLSKAYDN